MGAGTKANAGDDSENPSFRKESEPQHDYSENIDPIATLANEPCRVVDVRFEGARRTKPTILAKVVSDVFKSSSLQDCLIRSVQIRDNLKSLEAFSDVNIQIENIDQDKGDAYRVTFKVEERGRIAASANASVDNHSNKLTNFDLILPNLTGNCDCIKLSSKANTLGFISGKRLNSHEFLYTVPIRPWRALFNPVYSLSYGRNQYGAQPSGYDLEERSIANKVDFYSSPNTHHSISWDNIWRFIKTSSVNIPIEIREQSGHSVKSALKHTVTWDNRVYRGNFPSGGINVELSNEFPVTQIKDFARFTKHEASLQINARLPSYDVLGQMSLTAGAMGINRAAKYDICDKYFPGGPLTMRGFEHQGLGPNIRGHPIGVLSYFTAGLHLYPKLPYTTPGMFFYKSLRPHLFVNMGTVGDLNLLRKPGNFEDVKKEAHRFSDSMRYSAGIGLAMHAWGLRWEINYCIPIISKESDMTRTGLQWGFGFRYS